MNDVDRPNPDELLKAVSRDADQERRGRLKIFFGSSAGVGKTYAMLQAARHQQEAGVAVAIGIVETHGRAETERLLDGFAILPRKHMAYRERTLEEFDLDAALDSRAQLLLVDEFAHSNVPGSRHAKRWQDVEELLDAGFDVYTTLNVQHLDSLNDIVGGITGIRVQETVPDRVFDEAGEVVLIDLPADDLLRRLEAGQVYLSDAAERAVQNFFRKGNLIALRELALRRVADRVNSDVRSYRIKNAIHKVWPTHERLMVCIKADCSHENLIREGARLAQRLQADWIVVHIDEPSRGRGPGDREALRELAASAQAFGVEFASIPAVNVAQGLLYYARVRNATKLVLGHGESRLQRFWRTGVIDRITRAKPEIDILLARTGPTSQAPAALRSLDKASSIQMLPIVLATLLCAVATLLASALVHVFDVINMVMLFMATVVLATLRFGRIAGIWSALMCVACLDFFFVEPRLSFAVSDTQYVFTLGLMLVISVIISQLAIRLKSEAVVAIAGERRAAAVARVTQTLSGAIRTEQIVAVCNETIAPLLSVRVALILPDLESRLIPVEDLDFVDLSVAQWSYDHTQPAGAGTQTLNGANAQYLPLRAPMRVRGVLALSPGDGPIPTDPDDRRLLDALCSSLAMALERIHFVEIAQDTLVKMEGERLRNALLAAVSHDLKTPLTAIRGLAETLERTESLPRVQAESLASAIRQQAEGLQSLVLNLLDLAKMQSCGVRLNKEWHALAEICGSALGHSQGMLQGHPMRTDFPADLPLIEVDALLIERVLINLFDNAAKYSGEHSTITVRARQAGDAIYLLVEDNGPGFPGKENEQLFTAFERGQKESSIAGVGLGLALCRTIVSAHGGSIRAQQASPHGAIFEIRLPLGTPPAVELESTP